jgi:Cft2 family RNA processing exonuclease
MLSIKFLGAAQTVTGSCFLVENGSQRILIDCGLVQGHTELTLRNRLPFDFDPTALDAVLLTHAHLDHTGLVPKLVAEGFRGRILTTGITKELLPILWDDAIRIQDPSLYTEFDVNQAILRCSIESILPCAILRRRAHFGICHRRTVAGRQQDRFFGRPRSAREADHVRSDHH